MYCGIYNHKLLNVGRTEQFKMLKGSEFRGRRQQLQWNLCPSRFWAEGQRGGPQRAGRGCGAELGQWGGGCCWWSALKWFCCLIGCQRRLRRTGWCVLGIGRVRSRVLSLSASAGKEGDGQRWAVFEGKEGCSGDVRWEVVWEVVSTMRWRGR